MNLSMDISCLASQRKSKSLSSKSSIPDSNNSLEERTLSTMDKLLNKKFIEGIVELAVGSIALSQSDGFQESGGGREPVDIETCSTNALYHLCPTPLCGKTLLLFNH